MKKKIQIVAEVLEAGMGGDIVTYETAKHDSISDAETDLHMMMQTTRDSKNISCRALSQEYNIVDCYKDEMMLQRFA